MSADYVDDYLAYLGLTGNEQLREFLRTLGFRTWEGSGNHKMAFERFTEITARR